MEYKTIPSVGVKVQQDQGIVEHIIAVFGNVDLGNDIVMPGSFTKTLAERGLKVRVLDQHRTDSIQAAIGKPIAIQEIGKDELPEDILSQFPEATGGVKAKTQFLINTPEGLGAFERIKSGVVDEWSFGYDALDVDHKKIKSSDGEESAVRMIKQLRLWEYGPVLFGMNPATSTVGTKSMETKPWDVFKRGGKFCVYKVDDNGDPIGKRLGTHDTEEEAQAQMRALYANEPEAGKASWTAVFINNLPDSSFLYIESGGEKDEEGKTKPRSLRHLPYKDADGNVDLGHLRNALSRLGQVSTGSNSGDSWLSEDLRNKLRTRAEKILEDANKAISFNDAIAKHRAQEQLRESAWSLDSAKEESIHSIAVDKNLDYQAKIEAIKQTLDQYLAAFIAWFPQALDAGYYGDAESASKMLQTKAGRVLAARNVARIQAAVMALQEALADAGIPASPSSEEEDNTQSEEEDTGKSAAGPAEPPTMEALKQLIDIEIASIETELEV